MAVEVLLRRTIDGVGSVGDICKVGDTMEVKVIAVDDQDRVKLSRRAAMADAEEAKTDA